MLYFRKIQFPIESKEKTEQLLNQSISKVLTMFDLTQTNAYVIPEERPFAGQRLDTGEVLISRYRHAIFKIAPRIITKWKIECINGEFYLITRTRLALVSSIGLLIISFPILLQLVKSIINFELPDTEAILLSISFLGLFIFLTKNEITKTEKIIKKVIKGERVKSTITV